MATYDMFRIYDKEFLLVDGELALEVECCCCIACADHDYPDELTITLADIANAVCIDCPNANGEWTVTKSGSCIRQDWPYNYDSHQIYEATFGGTAVCTSILKIVVWVWYKQGNIQKSRGIAVWVKRSSDDTLLGTFTFLESGVGAPFDCQNFSNKDIPYNSQYNPICDDSSATCKVDT